jgi:hypothetical protein
MGKVEESYDQLEDLHVWLEFGVTIFISSLLGLNLVIKG